MPTHSNRDLAILTARHWMECDPVFLDTETTGLDTNAQICDLAIVDGSGQTLFDSLVKPTMPIPDAASSIHHITNEMVSGALPLSVYWNTIRRLLSGRLIITYNADYDLRLLYQSAAAARCPSPFVNFLQAGCVMQLYARYYGELTQYGGAYRWHKLTLAAQQCGIDPGSNPLHRALADTQLSRLVTIHMAQAKLEAEREAQVPWEAQLEPF
ncbi:MAG TPA: 3'-5' exonuclease [Dissulfurispiraceae bacterium]|nr:3'-5' exonuclease [Dissulfurispiraceae bacterium]